MEVLNIVSYVALVVAQLAERLLLTPIQSPASFYIVHLFNFNCIENTKIKKKRPGMALFIKNMVSIK